MAAHGMQEVGNVYVVQGLHADVVQRHLDVVAVHKLATLEALEDAHDKVLAEPVAQGREEASQDLARLAGGPGFHANAATRLDVQVAAGRVSGEGGPGSGRPASGQGLAQVLVLGLQRGEGEVLEDVRRDGVALMPQQLVLDGGEGAVVDVDG